MVSLRSWQPNCLENSVYAPFNLAIESIRLLIVHNSELRVTYPRVHQLFVQGNGLVNCFVSRLVVGVTVELWGSIGGSDHVDHSLVAAIAKLDRAPMSVIEECLPNFLRSVRLSIHDSSIAQDHSSLVTLDCCLKEDILETHLRLHYLNLEADLVHQGHLVGLNEATAFHHQSGSLGYEQHLEPLSREHIGKSCQGRSLARTRPACQANTVDRVL